MQISLANTVRSLEIRRGVLAKELAKIDARLSAISHAMAPGDEPKVAGRRGAAGRRGKRVAQGGGERRSWFEREEAPRLLKQAAKSPMMQADLVRAVAKAKGYTNKLADDEMKRFQSAAYMAISKALKDKVLRRAAGGKVVAA